MTHCEVKADHRVPPRVGRVHGRRRDRMIVAHSSDANDDDGTALQRIFTSYDACL